MKPKAVVNVGNITLNVDVYTDKDLREYHDGLHRRVTQLFDECSSDDLIAGVVTPYGADARIKYRSPVLDKTGNNIVNRSKFTIEEIAGTGELPPSRTFLEWKIMILENLLEGLNSPTNKHSSITNVNNLIDNIKNKKIEDGKVNNSVVIDNTQSGVTGVVISKPVNLVTTTPSTSDSSLSSGWVPLLKKSNLSITVRDEVVQKQWCRDGHLWTHVPSANLNSTDMDEQIVIPNCSFCQETRSVLTQFIGKVRSFFKK